MFPKWGRSCILYFVNFLTFFFCYFPTRWKVWQLLANDSLRNKEVRIFQLSLLQAISKNVFFQKEICLYTGRKDSKTQRKKWCIFIRVKQCTSSKHIQAVPEIKRLLGKGTLIYSRYHIIVYHVLLLLFDYGSHLQGSVRIIPHLPMLHVYLEILDALKN